MPIAHLSARRILLLAALLVVSGLGLFAGSALSKSPARGLSAASSAPPPRLTTAASGPASSTASPLPSRSQWQSQFPYPLAAKAVRDRDYGEARRLLLPRLETDPDALLVLGLIAHHFDETGDAERYLQQADGRSGDLEDWRLLALGEAALANHHLALARIAQERLLADHPYSNLRQQTLVSVVELEYEAARTERAFELVDTYRTQDFSRHHLKALEHLAWDMAVESSDRRRQVESARRLLVYFPLEASGKKAVELFRRPSGEVPWREFLSTEELVERARQLLVVDLVDSARGTLDEVPAEHRDSHWHRASAEVLLRQQRGVEALATLVGIEGSTGAAQIEINWLRAMASLEAARVRKNRPNLDSSSRERHRQQAVSLLRSLAADGLDAQRAEEALKLVFAQLTDDADEDFESSLAILRQLKSLSPLNSSGALYLWRKGWGEYKSRNFTGAIGYWSELAELYPTSSYTRSGLYWSARSYRHLGEEDAARKLLTEIASNPTHDFYRRYAQLHLDTAPTPITPARRQAWPVDLRLHRASVLSDLGLDDFALSELDALREKVDEGAYNALRATILERQGKRRESITYFYRAFRTLGTSMQHSVPLDAWRGYYPIDHADIVTAKAVARGLSPYTVFGIIRQESAFDTRATSYAGARGLMQVMPATGQELARKLRLTFSRERLYDPDFSVELGTSYFRQVLDMFEGQVELALAGYNSGPYRMKRLWREAGDEREMDFFIEDLHSETPKTYVKRILLFADSYEQLYPEID